MRFFPKTRARIAARRSQRTAIVKQQIRAAYEAHPTAETRSEMEAASEFLPSAEKASWDTIDLEARTRGVFGHNFNTSGKNYLEIGPSNNPQISGREVDYLGVSKKEMGGLAANEVFEGDAEHWKHPDKKTYFGVTVRRVFPFVSDHKLFANRLSELVSPGGHLVITEVPWDNLGISRKFDEATPPHFRSISRRKLSRLLARNSFEVLETAKGKSGMYWLHAQKK